MERKRVRAAPKQHDIPADRVQDDERERDADERERETDERERLADERARRPDAAAESRRQESWQALERSRALLAASEDRLDRTEALLRRANARAERKQAGDRPAGRTKRTGSGTPAT